MESAGSLNFMGIPIMRTKLATTAFKMPLYGISFPLSASSELLTEASKPLFNKGLLLSDQSFSGRQFHKTPNYQNAISLCLEQVFYADFTAAKSSNGATRLFLLKEIYG